MVITPEIQQEITKELLYDFHGKMDGSKRNILIPSCPFCGHDGYKYGIYVGKNIGSKRFGASNCYSCNRRFKSLDDTLKALGKEELVPKETTELDDCDNAFSLFEEDIDVELKEIQMPKGYKRCFKNPYLKSRGWIVDDYEYFPVGTNRGFSRDLQDYVILEVRDKGKCVGYVARSILSKDEIESHNSRHPRYRIMRYKNSNEAEGNGFSRMIYNYDAIIPMETHSVIVCEGPFDVVALNRKLELYDNNSIVPIATFGKKISMEQMYKLQLKGVEQVVLGYDNDAKETTSNIAKELDEFFDVLIADIPDGVGKDWDEMDVEDIYDIFSSGLKTVREFNLD